MRIELLFFASYRELVGTGTKMLQVPHGASVAEVVAEVRALGEGFARLPPIPVVAVNETFSSEDRILEDGDVVAFIPPVAGG